MIDTVHLSRALTERFGLEVEASASEENSGKKVTIIPSGIEHTISFRVELYLGWRTVSPTFIPRNYASGLVKGIKSASSSQKAAFAVFSDSLRSKGAKVSLNLDQHQVDASKPASWPEDWINIRISMKKIGVIVERATGYDFNAVFPWATGFFGLAIALLPLEEIEESLLGGKSEGAALIKLVKQYERSRINRAACIEVHGTDCKICGFSFDVYFGELGDGFIHVHHIVPVSEMGGSYILDPAKDLIPVCPNCHSMLHRRKPALSPEELIRISNKDK
jgi:5-methylcytosine-specific restriction protein A